MKNKIKFILIVTCASGVFSCTKQEIESKPLAAVNVINVAVNAGTVQVNNTGSPVSWLSYNGSAGKVNYAASGVFSIPATNFPVTIVPQADTLHPIFNDNIGAAAGDIYSLYLIGQTSPYETLLLKENSGGSGKIQPVADSSINVRVINLSANAPAVNVTLSTSTTINEFSNLAYKESSDFKNYPAASTNPASYTFQVRKVSDNSLVTSVSVSTTTYKSKNITLVLRGLVSGSPSAGITIVRNY